MSSLRRSLHFVPGSSEKMFGKALNLPADSLILDLEDAVTPSNKSEARRQVCEWLGSDGWGNHEKLVRINPLESPWGRDDLETVMAGRPAGIVLPKIKDPVSVRAVDVLLTALEREAGLEPGSTELLLIATESAAAVLNLSATFQHPRITSVAWAAEDLSHDLGAHRRRDDQGNYLDVFQTARSLCLLAAVAHGKQPIDGPFVDIRDGEALARECRLTADMGYTGKLTIHPGQIEIVNRAYSPADAEVALARELLEAFAQHRSVGRMAFQFHGEMVDVPHLRRAESLLARAEHIKRHEANSAG